MISSGVWDLKVWFPIRFDTSRTADETISSSTSFFLLISRRPSWIRVMLSRFSTMELSHSESVQISCNMLLIVASSIIPRLSRRKPALALIPVSGVLRSWEMLRSSVLLSRSRSTWTRLSSFSLLSCSRSITRVIWEITVSTYIFSSWLRVHPAQSKMMTPYVFSRFLIGTYRPLSSGNWHSPCPQGMDWR